MRLGPLSVGDGPFLSRQLAADMSRFIKQFLLSIQYITVMATLPEGLRWCGQAGGYDPGDK
jgi:hypothetical protein